MHQCALYACLRVLQKQIVAAAHSLSSFAPAQEGKGQWSSTTTAQTAAVPPDSPSMPTVMGSNRTSVSIRWQAPEADGGSPVFSYEVELRPKSKASLAGISDEWVTVYQVSSEALSNVCVHLKQSSACCLLRTLPMGI